VVLAPRGVFGLGKSTTSAFCGTFWALPENIRREIMLCVRAQPLFIGRGEGHYFFKLRFGEGHLKKCAIEGRALQILPLVFELKFVLIS